LERKQGIKQEAGEIAKPSDGYKFNTSLLTPKGEVPKTLSDIGTTWKESRGSNRRRERWQEKKTI